MNAKAIVNVILMLTLCRKEYAFPEHREGINAEGRDLLPSHYCLSYKLPVRLDLLMFSTR